jgi:glycosyltransferase involved in cell wall biosynthesis
LKIANILFSTQNGGVEQSFVNYCKILSNIGHDVLAIVGYGAPYIKDLQGFNIKIVEVKNRFGYHDFLAIAKIKKSLENFDTNLAFAHTGRAIVLARKAIKSTNKIPLIAVNHSKNVKRSIGADFILSVNEEIYRRTIEFGQDENKSLVMPNFIDINKKQGFTSKNSLEKKQTIIIGTIARLSQEKRIEFLIKATKILHDNNYQIKLKIAGSGEEEETLKSLCNSLNLQRSVEFLGWIDDRKKFFDDIDIFCLASKEETFGLVLLEAMLYKRPIITTETDGARMILKDKVSGILIDNSKPDLVADLIASAILDLISNPEVVSDLTNNAYNDLTSLYSSEAAQNNFKNLLSKFEL